MFKLDTVFNERNFKMNRAELVSAIAEKAGITKVDAGKAVGAFIDVVEGEVIKGNKVALVGFGTFEAKKRAARTGHNPKTGETIQIAAKTVPAFIAGKTFKDKVNG